jgi:hypothetical protein
MVGINMRQLVNTNFPGTTTFALCAKLPFFAIIDRQQEQTNVWAQCISMQPMGCWFVEESDADLEGDFDAEDDFSSFSLDLVVFLGQSRM